MTQQTVDITTMETKDLMAFGYEQYVLRDITNQNLINIENEIKKRQNEKPIEQVDNGK